MKNEEKRAKKINDARFTLIWKMSYFRAKLQMFFFIARRYQVDGPPIGVEYFEDQENPDKPPEAEAVNAWRIIEILELKRWRRRDDEQTWW